MSKQVCRACEVEKPLEDFYKMAARPNGRHYYCKVCCALHRKRDAVQVRDNRTKVSNRQRYRAEVQLRVEADASITIAKLYIRDKGICALCGQHVPPQVASIDHTLALANGGRHVWENVQLVHQNCNSRKGTKEISKLPHRTRSNHKPRTSSTKKPTRR